MAEAYRNLKQYLLFTMKPFSASLFFLTMASLVSLVTGQSVAILFLINGGRDAPDGACSAGDRAIFYAALLTAYSNANKRNLRTSRQLDPLYCASYCKTFVTGTCRLVYPLCTSYRALEEMSTEEQQAAVIPEHETRDLQLAGSTLADQCSAATRAIFSTVKTQIKLGTFTSPCVKFLKHGVSSQCYAV